jgi:hypothetical protein
MKKIFVLVVLLLTVASIRLTAAERKTVFIFYYPWYGSPWFDGTWEHWQEYKHQPPYDISSSYYPKLGPYSSSDPNVIEQHMKWISSAGIDVVIYSWWGREDVTNQNVKIVLDAAADHQLHVAFLIEPYDGRTSKKICDDMEYLNQKYRHHPAFFRLARSTKYGIDPRPRPVFFVYSPEFSDDELMSLADRIHDSESNAMLLLQSSDIGLIDRTHADGIFAYEAYQSLMHFYGGIVQAAAQENSVFIPCVSPGFNINRTIGRNTGMYRPRRHGATYDHWWEKVVAAGSEFVSIISFNEWHEGTQVEPAAAIHMPFSGYYSYAGSYGKNGDESERSYLQRTRRWIHLFQQAGAEK